MAQAALNPFWIENDEELIPVSQVFTEPVAETSGSKKESKKSTISGDKKPKRTYKKKEKAPSLPPVVQALPNATVVASSDSDSDEPSASVPPPTPAASTAPKRKRASEIEEEITVVCKEPVRAAPLRSFLNQRAASGYTSQSDPARSGEYYFELRAYSSREIERVPNNERWKHSIITLKLSTDLNTPVWTALTRLVQVGRNELNHVQPILYSTNPF